MLNMVVWQPHCAIKNKAQPSDPHRYENLELYMGGAHRSRLDWH